MNNGSMWVYAEVPLFESDVQLDKTMSLRCYPMKDLAFINSIADDLEFYGNDEKWHVFETREREYEVRNLIARYDPDAFCEIECRREANALASSEAA